MSEALRIVVAGDVDSGKSTLIGRMMFEAGVVPGESSKDVVEFAYLLDSFEEERKGELTIDTTQAFLKGKPGKDLVLIDVPGHKYLFKNMLSGSSYAEAALLLVDVNNVTQKGIKRHANALKFLGIDNMIVVLNKMDSVAFSRKAFDIRKEKISGYLKEAGLKPFLYLPVSAKFGDNIIKRSANMKWFDDLPLYKAMTGFPARKNKASGKDLCFPVQDTYILGHDKISAGMVFSGAIKKGQVVNIIPGGKGARVKKIRLFESAKSRARKYESIGLVLDSKEQASRGQFVCTGKILKAGKSIKARVFCVRRFDTGKELTLKCLTQECLVKIAVSPHKLMKAMDVADMALEARTPIVTAEFKELPDLGRFVLQKDDSICAVGMIL